MEEGEKGAGGEEEKEEEKEEEEEEEEVIAVPQEERPPQQERPTTKDMPADDVFRALGEGGPRTEHAEPQENPQRRAAGGSRAGTTARFVQRRGGWAAGHLGVGVGFESEPAAASPAAVAALLEEPSGNCAPGAAWPLFPAEHFFTLHVFLFCYRFRQ